MRAALLTASNVGPWDRREANGTKRGIMQLQKWWSDLSFRTVATLYLTIDFGGLLLRALLSNPAEALGQGAFWVFLDAFLLYRVAEGSKGAWRVLLVLTALQLASLPFGVVEIPRLLAFALVLFHLGLLLHPAIRRRVGSRRRMVTTRAQGSD